MKASVEFDQSSYIGMERLTDLIFPLPDPNFLETKAVLYLLIISKFSA